MTTAYIFVAIRFEEKDLVTIHGRDYASTGRSPMMLPFGKKQKAAVSNYDKAA